MTEDPDYLSKQLITYLGNKRALLPELATAVGRVIERLGRKKLRVLDAFAGSGVVSRLLKRHSKLLISNDVEAYAVAIGTCFLTNRSTIRQAELDALIQAANSHADEQARCPGSGGGFFEELYAPADDHCIQKGERVFYSRSNARRLDRYCRFISRCPDHLRPLLLGPLLSEASVHANTAGVFKGFYKDRATGNGRFGGSNGDALSRILGEVRLSAPILSRFECDTQITRGDAHDIARHSPDLDLAYFDPPYNQHPYGSNYFMLNLIVDYRRPTHVSRVSGIPHNWQRSDYNRRAHARCRLAELFHQTDARFILLSFSDEGFVSRREIESLLRGQGRLEVFERPYNAFRGSRNLSGRPLHLTEFLFLIER